MELGNKSTRRYELAAIAAVFISVLFIGFTSGTATAADTVSGPPTANTPTPESIRVSKLCGADGSGCAPAAAQTDPAAPPNVIAKPGLAGTGNSTNTGGPNTGGATPGQTTGDKPAGAVNPGGKDATEPAFVQQDPTLSSGGAPASTTDPGTTSTDPLQVTPLSIPNFLINKFEIPPFLLPIYQACGSEYGVDWEVLAAINRIETNFGELATATSTAGAEGWMQFMPATWAGYGVDANGDKVKDPTNPVDAICAAANYLKAAGYADSPSQAIFAYNHADWYVQDVLSHAKAYAAIPPELISALTGLTDGARFPVTGDASYEGEVSVSGTNKPVAGNDQPKSDANRQSIAISGEPNAPVIAVNDGTVTAMNAEAGTVTVTDAYGNRYSYSGLGSMATSHPVPRPKKNTTVGDDPGVPVESAPIVAAPPTASSDEVIRQMGDSLLGRGYSVIATAGIIGNAYRESGLNPASVGTGGGGLFGFTSGAISLASLQAAADSSGVEWTDVDFQIGFMDAHMDSDLKKRLNATDNVADSTQLFMDEWERPGIPAYEDRLAGAQKALEVLGTTDPSASGGASPAFVDEAASSTDTQPQVDSQTPSAPTTPAPDAGQTVDPNAAAATDTPSDAASSTQEATKPDKSTPQDAVSAAEDRRAEQDALIQGSKASSQTRNTEDMRGRMYANPLRPQNQHRATVTGVSTKVPTPNGGDSTSLDGGASAYVIYDGGKNGVYKFDPKTTDLKPLVKGSRVIAGTVLGRLADQPGAAIDFSIQPGGEDAPQIDPKPFLDGWKLLAETNIYSARGDNRLASNLGPSGVLLLSKPALQRRVLADPGLDIYECGRQDIAAGLIDRRILAALEYLRSKGFTMTITALECGHGTYTTSGNVSEHTTGDAVDIAAFNGQVVTPATQGPGTFIDQAARDVMGLQGAMTPHQVISLTDYGNGIGFAMADHYDHLHIGYSPDASTGGPGAAITTTTLGADQWEKLTERLGEIGNPVVQQTPSGAALPVNKSDGKK